MVPTAAIANPPSLVAEAAVLSGRTAYASERRNGDAVGLVRRLGAQPHLRVVRIAWWVVDFREFSTMSR